MSVFESVFCSEWHGGSKINGAIPYRDIFQLLYVLCTEISQDVANKIADKHKPTPGAYCNNKGGSLNLIAHLSPTPRRAL